MDSRVRGKDGLTSGVGARYIVPYAENKMPLR